MNEQELVEIEERSSRDYKVIGNDTYDDAWCPLDVKDLLTEVHRLRAAEAYLTRAYDAVSDHKGVPCDAKAMIDFLANAAVTRADQFAMAQEDIAALKAQLENTK